MHAILLHCITVHCVVQEVLKAKIERRDFGPNLPHFFCLLSRWMAKSIVTATSAAAVVSRFSVFSFFFVNGTARGHSLSHSHHKSEQITGQHCLLLLWHILYFCCVNFFKYLVNRSSASVT